MTESKHNWLYLGRRISVPKSGKPRIVYAWRDQGGEEHWYKKRLVEAWRCSPGAVYTMTIDGDGSVYTGGTKKPVFVDIHEDEEYVDKLKAEDKAAHQELQLIKEVEKANEKKPFVRHLDAIQMAYRDMRPQRRAAFLGWVIWYVTRP